MRPYHPARVTKQLAARLKPGGGFALAYSGGGDSHALLLTAAAFARETRRALTAIIIDHGLRPESAREARAAAARAEVLGVRVIIRTWTGEKPTTGVQAAARRARHRLIAEAMSEAGLHDLLLGHTLDDQAETVWMRLQAGGGWTSLAGMAPAGLSPLWPEGRGLRLLRPLLGECRAALRAWMADQGEAWIEDPSNLDRNHTRIRIRDRLEVLETAGFQPERLAGLAGEIRAALRAERAAAGRVFLDAVRVTPWGGVRLDHAELAAAPRRAALRAFDAALAGASGGARTPEAGMIERLFDACLSGEMSSGAGALVRPRGETVWLVRDPGAVLGRVDHPEPSVLELEAGETGVWDGRFAVRADHAISIRPLGRDYSTLPARDGLAAIPGAARAGLPLLCSPDGAFLASPGLGEAAPGVEIEPLTLERALTRLFPEGVPAWFDASSLAMPDGCDANALHTAL